MAASTLAQPARIGRAAGLVLHHGDGPWNAPTRPAELFVESAPDTYAGLDGRGDDHPREGGRSGVMRSDLFERRRRLMDDWAAYLADES